MVSNVPNIHLGIYKNYQNFRPLIFYGYTRLRGVGADLPPLGGIGLSFVFDGRTEYAPFLLKTYKTVIFAQKPVFATLHTIYLKSAP